MKTTVNIEDLKTAFVSKNNSELKFTYYIFKTLQYPRLLKLLTSCANGIVKYNLPVKVFIKKTIFKLFCAGETLNDALNVIKKLDTYHVKAVLDYVSEGEKSQIAYAKNTEIIINNIIKLGQENPGNYVSVKLSGLEDSEYFRKINGKSAPTELNDGMRFATLLERIDMICGTAAQHKVILYIDAEDYYMQAIFDRITERMMEKYNKEYAVVFNTLQMYLTDRLEYLDFLIKEGEQKKYIPGIKLVRGAYVEKEREAARLANKKSPVYETKEQTDKAFNQAVDICLREYKKVDCCVASHNAASTLFATECIEKYGIRDHYQKVRFSQLYGMSDNLTFNLAAQGYNSSKYLPYGELKKAIPYLIRRAEENSSISGQITGELMRLKNEIWRRKTNDRGLVAHLN